MMRSTAWNLRLVLETDESRFLRALPWLQICYSSPKRVLARSLLPLSCPTFRCLEDLQQTNRSPPETLICSQQALWPRSCWRICGCDSHQRHKHFAFSLCFETRYRGDSDWDGPRLLQTFCGGSFLARSREIRFCILATPSCQSSCTEALIVVRRFSSDSRASVCWQGVRQEKWLTFLRGKTL